MTTFLEKIVCTKYNYLVFDSNDMKTYNRRYAICDSYEGIFKFDKENNRIYINVKCEHCGKK
jgi:hypothetical protein